MATRRVRLRSRPFCSADPLDCPALGRRPAVAPDRPGLVVCPRPSPQVARAPRTEIPIAEYVPFSTYGITSFLAAAGSDGEAVDRDAEDPWQPRGERDKL